MNLYFTNMAVQYAEIIIIIFLFCFYEGLKKKKIIIIIIIINTGVIAHCAYEYLTIEVWDYVHLFATRVFASSCSWHLLTQRWRQAMLAVKYLRSVLLSRRRSLWPSHFTENVCAQFTQGRYVTSYRQRDLQLQTSRIEHCAITLNKAVTLQVSRHISTWILITGTYLST